MFQSVKLARGQILGLVLLFTPAPEQQQLAPSVEATQSASYAIAEKAIQWMPESFRRVMSRNMEGLRDGINEVRIEKLVMPSERLDFEEDVLQRMSGTVSRLQSRPRFSEVSKDFGALTQMMLLLNLPEVGADSSYKLLTLRDAIGRNSPAFRIVVYDASEIGGGRDEVKNFLETVRERRKKLSERFAEIQALHLAVASSGPLDPRSQLYGIAALVFSHSINDTARAWLWVWQSANGDMSGRLSLQLQP